MQEICALHMCGLALIRAGGVILGRNRASKEYNWHYSTKKRHGCPFSRIKWPQSNSMHAPKLEHNPPFVINRFEGLTAPQCELCDSKVPAQQAGPSEYPMCLNLALVWGMLPGEKFQTIPALDQCGLKSFRSQSASSGGKESVAIHRRKHCKWGHPRPTRHASLLLWWLWSGTNSIVARDALSFWPMAKVYWKTFGGSKPQDLTLDVGHGFAIGPRANPCDKPPGLKSA